MNENCLEGMGCPKCGFSKKFNISASCFVVVTDDGTDDAENFVWEDESYCQCTDCGYEGTVADFKENVHDESGKSLKKIHRLITNSAGGHYCLLNDSVQHYDRCKQIWEFLKNNARATAQKVRSEYGDHVKTLNDPDGDGDFLWADPDSLDDFVSYIETVMQGLAPAGYYFGVHMVDRTDYGFWPIKEWL